MKWLFSHSMIKKIQYNYCFFCFLNTRVNVIRVVKLLIIFIVFHFSAYAEERKEYEMINITAGQIGILDDQDGAQRYGLEYRFTSFSGPWGFRLIPAIGVAAANNGAGFVYSDLRHDFYLNDKWILIPSFGAGVFKDSSEINLGNSLEFRSGVEIAYQFHNKCPVLR